MEYLNLKQLKEAYVRNETFKEMIETIQKEVDIFCPEFKDSPEELSAWGHQYFCEIDGGRLLYDRKKPREHQCEICGKSYDTELFHQVWVYMYRNEAISNAWKSALIYRLTEDEKYLGYVKNIIGFYATHYEEFTLHNKEGNIYDSIEEMQWGCGRIMPQGLNESIFMIRAVNALELVKETIGQEFLEKVHQQLFRGVFNLLKPQVDKVHNIICWNNCVIGTMGLFAGDKEMIQFAFEGEFNVRRQLREGVRSDGFWYEGSIHYNFFTLEGVTNLLLFSELYNQPFGEEKAIVEKMFDSAYHYAFDNQQLPNPNDGWPNLNLKTYSYIYSIATKVFGVNSHIGNLLGNILKADYERGTLPLSKPYYYKNDVSLEQLILVPELIPSEVPEVKTSSTVFETSYCGILKHEGINIFCKYGHNGPSHAHPDKMNIEVVIGEHSLSRDLSNSGYGNRLCNEWHRVSASHNTVVVNGQNHVSVEAGECLTFEENLMEVKAVDVYKGIDYRRKLEITEAGFKDEFEVTADTENTYDYFFHYEAELLTQLETEPGDLVFNENGYQHISDVKKVITNESDITLEWRLGDYIIENKIDLRQKELFVGTSLDNPVNNSRTTLIVRGKSSNIMYLSEFRVKEGV